MASKLHIAKYTTNLKIIELYSFNEQASTLRLLHYSKFRLISYSRMIFSADAI